MAIFSGVAFYNPPEVKSISFREVSSLIVDIYRKYDLQTIFELLDKIADSFSLWNSYENAHIIQKKMKLPKDNTYLNPGAVVVLYMILFENMEMIDSGKRRMIINDDIVNLFMLANLILKKKDKIPRQFCYQYRSVVHCSLNELMKYSRLIYFALFPGEITTHVKMYAELYESLSKTDFVAKYQDLILEKLGVNLDYVIQVLSLIKREHQSSYLLKQLMPFGSLEYTTVSKMWKNRFKCNHFPKDYKFISEHPIIKHGDNLYLISYVMACLNAAEKVFRVLSEDPNRGGEFMRNWHEHVAVPFVMSKLRDIILYGTPELKYDEFITPIDDAVSVITLRVNDNTSFLSYVTSRLMKTTEKFSKKELHFTEGLYRTIFRETGKDNLLLDSFYRIIREERSRLKGTKPHNIYCSLISFEFNMIGKPFKSVVGSIFDQMFIKEYSRFKRRSLMRGIKAFNPSELIPIKNMLDYFNSNSEINGLEVLQSFVQTNLSTDEFLSSRQYHRY